MEREAVRNYVNRGQQLFETSPQMDEANTKAAVLREFLDLLDWEIPVNTRLEYSVEAFGQTYKVDYALLLEGTPVAFLEAKGADTALNQNHDEQLSSYMMNKNVNYGILSNGKEYRFFQRRVDASNVEVQVVGNVSLQNLPNRLAVLRAYTKDAIESGESGKILGRINELREARNMLEAEKDELAAGLAGLLSEQVSGSISSLAESQSKEMIDRLIEDIDSEIDSDGDVETPSGSEKDSGGIEPVRNHIVGTIRREDIEGEDDAKVAVFPTQKSGLAFLKENNAWGFVRVGSEFDYVAMYLGGDVGEVRYFATARDVLPPNEVNLERDPLTYLDRNEIGEGKKVVRFEPNSLYELEDPIQFNTKFPQSLRYTTLGDFKAAKTTDDIL